MCDLLAWILGMVIVVVVTGVALGLTKDIRVGGGAGAASIVIAAIVIWYMATRC